MPRLDVFPACRLRAFAQLVSSKLGVQVRLKGKEICVRYGPPPVVFLPNLEFAKEGDLLPIYGFALHEAAHLKYSDPKVGAKSPNYLMKITHNAIEDVYIETRLEGQFPGAREMLERSYVEGVKAVCGERPMVDEKSFLMPERRPEVVAAMQKMGMDHVDETLVQNVAKRLEIMRACKLWILEARGYPLPRHEWPTHPWRTVFREETTPPARNSGEAYRQAERIIERLGVQPCLPDDLRPVEKVETARRLAGEAKAARAEWLRARRERNAEIKRKRETSLAHCRLRDAQANATEASKQLDAASKAAGRLQRMMERAKAAIGRLQNRLAKEQQLLDNLRERLAKAEGQDAEELRLQAEACAKRISELGEAIAKKQAELDNLREQFAGADKRLSEAKNADAKAKDELDEARKGYEREAASIRQEVAEKHQPAIEAAAKEKAAKQESARNAADEAEEAMKPIRPRDAEIGEQVAPGAVAAAVEAIFKRHREQSAEEELEGVVGAEDNGSVEREGETPKDKQRIRRIVSEALPAPARKYVPFDRSHDRVDTVAETPEGKAEYERARREYAKVIAETAERLRRLYSPSHTKVKVNAEQGRLDPRKAYRVGLALNGVACDLSKVWRTVTVRRDPKVAVSLLVDCSGSMSGEPMELARKAAACLSEVMSGLNIPHEIVGHTTASDELEPMLKFGEITPEDTEHFSRLVPFRGYVFKRFDERGAPASVFTEVSMQDNIDGEAILWAASRLAARPEKTKLLISISDGMPNATLANAGELERHLLMTCKAVEARQGEGLYLFGIGIGEERVAKFYKNSTVLKSVENLPKAVLGIVEHVLATLVGRLG